MKLIYSADAVQDLIRLRKFIAEESPSAANRISSDLIKRIDYICKFPSMGRPVQLAPDPTTIREMIYGKYIVRYAPREDAVIILRIWHQLENR